jgi:hypothetical protein
MKIFLFLLFFATNVFADNVLVVHQGYAGTQTNIGARLIAAGHNVTYTTAEPADLSGYQQVWDVRYSVAITGSLAAKYDTFIKNSGYLYLTAENPGCCAVRNNSVAAFISNAGGGATTIGGSAGSTSNTLSVVNTSYMTPNITINFAAGSNIVNSQGTWLFKDTSGKVGGMMWVGNAGNLGTGYNGTILVVSDINWTDSNYYTANNQTAVDNIIAGVVAGTVGGTITSNGNGSAASAGNTAPAAPVYTASITTTQQSKVTAARARQSYSNQVNIDQVGSYNNIDVIQSGTYHLTDIVLINNSNNLDVYQSGSKNYSKIGVDGAGNTANVYQSNSGANTVTGHFTETLLIGNSNTVNVTQTGDGEKINFTSINGNSNTVNHLQNGTGTKYSDIKATGNGHSITLDQKDGGNHAARIEVTNAGGSSNIIILQQGNTSQVYSIQQSCATVGGCNVTLTQQ